MSNSQLTHTSTALDSPTQPLAAEVTPEVANHPPDTPISAEAEAPDQPPVQFTFQEGRVRRDDDFNNITLKCGVKFYGKVITRVDLV